MQNIEHIIVLALYNSGRGVRIEPGRITVENDDGTFLILIEKLDVHRR